jgi:prepilin-type N-terminal cleavage/methylation domain-containing protein
MKFKSFIAAISSALALLASTAMVGFSLIELLVVVAIIGILAAIGTVGYNNYIISTKNAAVLANANAIAEALKACDAANNCPDKHADASAKIFAQNANMGNPFIPNVIGRDMVECNGGCVVVPDHPDSPSGQIQIVSVSVTVGNGIVDGIQVLACDNDGFNPNNYQADPHSPAPFAVNNLL